MVIIKKFMDKISAVEGRQGRDIVLTIAEARQLRDEITKLIVDNYDLTNNKIKEEPVIQVEMTGGKFK